MTTSRTEGTRASGRTAGRITAGLGAALAVVCLSAVGHADDKETRLKRLVDRIARGDEVEAAAAGEQLIELVTGPLADAIGSLDVRPAEEQVRLRRVMARLAGALRMRVFRIDLPPEDRKLFDVFAAAYPELVRRLFDDNYRVRMAAVLQVPLEPDTGAGVLIAGKVNDEDADVAKAALKVAAKLHDRVVARNLTRYIHDAAATVASGFYGPEQQDIARTIALFVWESLGIVADAQAAESVPALIEALRFFGHSAYWDRYHRAQAIHVLGKLDDERTTPVLLQFLDDPAQLRSWTAEQGQRASTTVGDVALLSLLRVYKLKPEDFGMLVPSGEKDFGGYTDDESRRAGHRALRIWHQQHAPEPSTQAHPPTSQPAHEKKE